MTSLASQPFEQEFPTAFAETVNGLIDGIALDDLLDHLCKSVSEQIAPRSVGLIRTGDAVADDNDLSTSFGEPSPTTQVIELEGGRRWGYATLSAARSDDLEGSELATITAFVSRVIDRHGSRRRRVPSIDRERQLIAGQLHDDSIQAMTAISLNLQRLARSPGVDRDQVEHLLHLVNDAIDRLRHMMFSLHPPALATDGLVVTLEDYLDGFIAPSGLITSVRRIGELQSTPEMEALAFRLARGAIHNAWKHADAGLIDVSVEAVDAGVKITVHDNGIGFDVNPAQHEVGHAGIEYARDLANEVGGTYDVKSTPGAGTAVTIVLPPG